MYSLPITEQLGDPAGGLGSPPREVGIFQAGIADSHLELLESIRHL
jgi:hypothetical protein